MKYKKEAINAINLMNEYGKNSQEFLFIIDFLLEKPIVMLIDEINENIIKYSINEKSNFQKQETNNIYKIPDLVFEPIEFDSYKFAFNQVVSQINQGNSYLLNLTFPTHFKNKFDLEALYSKVNSKYKLYYNNKFVCFSPESFVQIKDNSIYSYPMKGTIDGTLKNAEITLISDEKELAEHYTIVDLIRNDLSMVSDDVKVESFRHIEEIITQNGKILQTSSKISGKLTTNWKSQIGDIIFKMLPAGSISGAPKLKTLEIIQEVENYSRGYYTGVFGVFDGTSLDSAVMIRFIENINGEYFYKSGGGITSQSVLEDEYNELLQKIYVPIF